MQLYSRHPKIGLVQVSDGPKIIVKKNSLDYKNSLKNWIICSFLENIFRNLIAGQNMKKCF
jgi:hypothetical protein